MKRRSIDLCETPLLKGVIAYAVPIIFSSILQLLFNAADMIVLGQFCGSDAIGAVGASGVLAALLVHFFICLSVGVSVSTAYAIGAKEYDTVKNVVHTAIPLALILGAAIAVIGVIATPAILSLLSTPQELMEQATVYSRLYFTGTLATLLFNFGAAVLRAAGNTQQPLTYLTISGAVNVVLNVFFVLVLRLDVVGVAIATVMAQALSAFLVLRNLCRRSDACRLSLREMRLEKNALKSILKIGIPSGVQSLAFNFSNATIQAAINSFGAAALSGMAAGANVDAFLYSAEDAFAETAMNFIGQNMGAKKTPRVTGTLKICLLCVTAVGIIGGALLYLFRYPLLAIYLPDSNDAIEYGVTRLLYVGVPYCLAGIMNVASATLRGIKATTTAMIVTLLGACLFRTVWIYTLFQLPAFHTPEGLLISYPISWILTSAAALTAFAVIWKKKKRTLDNSAVFL